MNGHIHVVPGQESLAIQWDLNVRGVWYRFSNQNQVWVQTSHHSRWRSYPCCAWSRKSCHPMGSQYLRGAVLVLQSESSMGTGRRTPSLLPWPLPVPFCQKISTPKSKRFYIKPTDCKFLYHYAVYLELIVRERGISNTKHSKFINILALKWKNLVCYDLSVYQFKWPKINVNTNWTRRVFFLFVNYHSWQIFQCDLLSGLCTLSCFFDLTLIKAYFGLMF